MPGLRLTFREYIASIQMSKHPHILLEGTQDKSFFSRMNERSRSISRSMPVNVSITTAEELQAETINTDQAIGNRDKVELVCGLVGNRSFQKRFVGFVDREFRAFTFCDTIGDTLRSHHCTGRLVWSRGHSIENYMFDYEVFREPLCDFSPNQQVADVALDILKENFSEILNIGCALGLAARAQRQLSTVRRTVHWEILELTKSTLRWDTDKWSDRLTQHSHLDTSTSKTLACEFDRWLEIARSSDPEDVRWACDGHIGMDLIWSSYARIIYDIRRSAVVAGAKPNNQREAILRTNGNVKFNHLARKWARSTCAGGRDSPILCLGMIGIKATQ